MNKVILMGRTTAEIDVKSLENDKFVGNFTLAVRKNDKETNFIKCVAWNKICRTISLYVKKGDMLSLEGEIKTSSYVKNDTTFYKTEVLVTQIHLIPNKEKKQQ